MLRTRQNESNEFKQLGLLLVIQEFHYPWNPSWLYYPISSTVSGLRNLSVHVWVKLFFVGI